MSKTITQAFEDLRLAVDDVAVGTGEILIPPLEKLISGIGNLVGQTYDGTKYYVVGDVRPELIDFKPRPNKDKEKPEPIADNDDWWKWGDHA